MIPHDNRSLVLRHRSDGRRFAKSLLRRWGKFLADEEMFSAVDLALCEAASTYDPKHGAQFTTHAYLFVKGRILRHLKANSMGGRGGQDSVQPESAFGREELGTDAVSTNIHHLRPDTAVLRKQLLHLKYRLRAGLPEFEELVIRRTFLEEQKVVALASELGYSATYISRVKQRALRMMREQVLKYEKQEDV